MHRGRRRVRGIARGIRMKIAILGATSQSTPELFQSLMHLNAFRFALAARNPLRLDAVHRAIGLLTENCAQLDCHDSRTPAGLRSAVDGAQGIVIQCRYGGLEARDFDESFPLEFGICGDEGLGPGGLSAAWRSWPDLSATLKIITEVNPAATVLLLTSPAGLLTRLAALEYPMLRLKAFCELPWTTMQQSGASPKRYDYFGINHLGWIYGAGVSPKPLKYWRQVFEREVAFREQRGRRESRAAELRRLTENAIKVFTHGSRGEIEQVLTARPAPWYTHALSPLLDSWITGESATHFFFSVANRGRHPDFADDDILEIPHVRREDMTVRKPLLEPPKCEWIEMLLPLVRYEREAANAVLQRDERGLAEALALHPWVRSSKDAKNLVAAMTSCGVSA